MKEREEQCESEKPAHTGISYFTYISLNDHLNTHTYKETTKNKINKEMNKRKKKNVKIELYSGKVQFLLLQVR